MRRVVLLALLALAVPTLALASSIDYSGGGKVSGTASLKTGGSVKVTMDLTGINCGLAGGQCEPTGGPALGTVTFNTGLLTQFTSGCGTGHKCFSFTGGSEAITASGGGTLFSGTFSSGTVDVCVNSATGCQAHTFTVTAFAPNGTVSASLTVKFNGAIIGGSSNTFVTPEPGTLGLLGTGLIGLAGVVRRKFRA